jgi:peptidoglycan-associated lipoprotein
MSIDRKRQNREVRMHRVILVCVVLASLAVTACGKKKPATSPMPPPAVPAGGVTAPGDKPAQPVEEATPVATEPIAEDTIGAKSLDELNLDSPLKPAFFGLDSAELDASGQGVVQSNAELLKKYSSWVITIEGHCDERGTAEYNLALGERRAVAVRTYLVSLGIPPDRVRIVSYGKEFPFDPAHTESAWSKNRRAHFVITAK